MAPGWVWGRLSAVSIDFGALVTSKRPKFGCAERVISGLGGENFEFRDIAVGCSDGLGNGCGVSPGWVWGRLSAVSIDFGALLTSKRPKIGCAERVVTGPRSKISNFEISL